MAAYRNHKEAVENDIFPTLKIVENKLSEQATKEQLERFAEILLDIYYENLNEHSDDN